MSDQPDGARAHDQATVPEVSRPEKRLEVFATALLGLAALATAWSGYQASLWDGIQSSNYTQASAARTNASLKHTEANQFRLADLSEFENFIDASVSGDTALADFYRTRFRDEFEPAYEAWIALDPLTNPAAPASPLAMPEYQLAPEEEANDLTALAEAKFAEGENANTYSDVYTASTLFFASALFFAAISERFAYRRARLALLVLACAGLIAGVAVAFTQPITTG
ncbi:MAG TPA: hypothetical protein VFR13_03280 [Jiangellaceae bacterium]|nr:hypothetical protein [Jiangellaceae bacterium]